MYEISEETKAEAIRQMEDLFKSKGVTVPEDVLSEAFDIAVDVVKQSFGF